MPATTLAGMDTFLRKTLGQNIKARREELGLSKVDLCIAADIQRPILDPVSYTHLVIPTPVRALRKMSNALFGSI